MWRDAVVLCRPGPRESLDMRFGKQQLQHVTATWPLSAVLSCLRLCPPPLHNSPANMKSFFCWLLPPISPHPHPRPLPRPLSRPPFSLSPSSPFSSISSSLSSSSTMTKRTIAQRDAITNKPAVKAVLKSVVESVEREFGVGNVLSRLDSLIRAMERITLFCRSCPM